MSFRQLLRWNLLFSHAPPYVASSFYFNVKSACIFIFWKQMKNIWNIYFLTSQDTVCKYICLCILHVSVCVCMSLLSFLHPFSMKAWLGWVSMSKVVLIQGYCFITCTFVCCVDEWIFDQYWYAFCFSINWLLAHWFWM